MPVSATNDRPIKEAVVRGSVFEPLRNVGVDRMNPPAAVSMNYRMASGDSAPRDPIFIYDFDRIAGDDFKVYYSLKAPQTVAPCSESRAAIDGWVCK